MKKIAKGLGPKGIALLTLIIIAAISFYVGLKYYVGVGLSAMVVLSGLFLVLSYVKIESDPEPYNGILQVFGERTDVTLSDGYHLLPFYGWMFGFVKILMKDTNLDPPPYVVRTPDMAEIGVDTGITFSPDPDNLINYQLAGGAEGVKATLNQLMSETVRQFANDPDNPPYTWREAVKMADHFHNEVVERVAGLTPPAKDDPDADKSEFRKTLRDLKAGRGKIKIQDRGIILKRVNVENVHPMGELAKIAEKEAIEEARRLAEEVKHNHMQSLIRKYMQPQDKGGTGFSNEQSLEIVQSERGNVTKHIEEKKFSVSTETLDGLKDVVPALAAALKK